MLNTADETPAATPPTRTDPWRGLDTVAEFIDALGMHHDDGALYRGHAGRSWQIKPSVFRDGGRGIATQDELKRWRNRAARFAIPRPTNDLEWLVLAQHYGIATPLLDWTTNPLVALFFAADPQIAEDGCVWQFSRDAFETFGKPETVDVFKDRELPGLVDTQLMNTRSMAQDSVMSIHSKNVSRATDDNPWRREIFVVARADKRAVRRALQLFGIAEERLFDDIAVVVRNFHAETAALRDAEDDA